jgi:hypothetical protein
MAVIGLRDIIPTINLLPVKKIFCKFDISGDTKEPVLTNKHPVIGGACNLCEVISLEIDVPLNLDYAPVLTVYVYDNLMGFMGSRLVGVTNIPLEKYVIQALEMRKKLLKAASFMSIGAPSSPEPKKTLDMGMKSITGGKAEKYSNLKNKVKKLGEESKLSIS